MKTLVTGATGFLGSHLVERLKRDSEDVVCIAKDLLNKAELEAMGVNVVVGDVGKELQWDSVLDGTKVIYHLAGSTRARSRKEYFDNNHLATKNFVEVCRRKCKNLQRFVYFSSLAVVGPSLGGTPLDESAPYQPVSDYGRSKMHGELEVLKAKSDLPITVIRPASVYGPRERDLYELIKLVKRGLFPVIGFKDKFISILHAKDLIDAAVTAAKTPCAEGEIYHLGSEKVYRTQEIGEAIAQIVDKNPINLRIPHVLIYGAAGIVQLLGKISGKPVFFNVQKANEVVQPAWTCSTQKAQQHFHFKQNISLTDGLKNTHDWYRENGWL